MVIADLKINNSLIYLVLSPNRVLVEDNLVMVVFGVVQMMDMGSHLVEQILVVVELVDNLGMAHWMLLVEHKWLMEFQRNLVMDILECLGSHLMGMGLMKLDRLELQSLDKVLRELDHLELYRMKDVLKLDMEHQHHLDWQYRNR
jgi:hypothetical protein